ncbi:MAG: prephenate dehydrogenase/arogenate dehydrogenase family protein, partial [Actinobacteria bacterium]|nr:prephenate dehydrogenase/arogenate dehydrogenase family protein [Actinomycetota bacterium]NIT97005.1 prephenate dehydrogenase/arogenate dehydrogenase family protein [Actinomycetota bacterium]NIU20669.1 prephenate dehydrogenase/arogenate dehydrogenase family protein [Actinomycetota bacterium]NIV57183.1 prephenate dehydrogenase/arogenate dehydrogenase family protein [Actinomycetota bacterium]NIX51986.1 prephenate dehydrogenase/arogenate dehydrogenase family protein [Actinomycetota bacterium]
MPKAGILGTGLIGASIGQGLAAAGWEIAGWDPDPDALATAAELGAVAIVAPDEAAVLAMDLDVLVLAGPPESVAHTVATIDGPWLAMDVSGVKAAIVSAARPARFVGTHPMAGREHAGPRA